MLSYVKQLSGNGRLASSINADSPRATLEEFERDWEAFCEPVEGLLAEVDFSREAMYLDHD